MLKKIPLALSVFAILNVTSAHAENVEIYLTDILDNVQNGYCLDIARAQGDKANPDDGLQGHTCYSPSGELGVDQAFDAAKFSDGVLYMPEFDVCASVGASDAGTSIDLAACDGSAAQSFNFSGEGAIVPTSAESMCLTLAEATRTGRSDANQIKVLGLEACNEAQSAYHTWSVRSSAN
jgi:hypothetical protein